MVESREREKAKRDCLKLQTGAVGADWGLHVPEEGICVFKDIKWPITTALYTAATFKMVKNP